MTRQNAVGDTTGGMFAAIDRKDSTAFVAYLTDNAVFRFGSAPPVRGREAICTAVDDFFATITASSHVIHKAIRSGATALCEGEVTYTRLDGTSVALPFADVFEFEGELIAEYKIYIDIGPLYSNQA